ncbi:hypothetical protein VTH06DRAFT_7967 [Thermothelomyces fergusii]
MSGPGPGPRHDPRDQQDHYYQHYASRSSDNTHSTSIRSSNGSDDGNNDGFRNGYSNRLSYAPQLTTIPARRPVGASTSAVVNPSQVSPSDLTYPLHSAPSVSSIHTGTLRRMGTISSGGVFTVSPESSIHEEGCQDDEVWARTPESNQGPASTTYGRAPAQASAAFADSVPVAAPLPLLTPAPAHTATAGNGTIPDVSARMPWQQQHTQRQQVLDSHQEAALANPQSASQAHPTTTGRPSPGSGPFMHYEDVTYLVPSAAVAAVETAAANGFGEEPKDEAQVELGIPHADSFPPVLSELNRPEARRSWDRQRRRWRKQRGVGAPNGDGDGGDHQQRLRPRRNRDRAEYGGEEGGGRGRTAFLHFCDGWLVEMLCCLLSVVCLGVLVAVLKTYDGRSLSDWPLGVSLNTLAAFLAAICQVALAVPLTEGLGQLKWNSFARGERPLEDFVTFENARRWPVFGSALLLWRRKGRILGMSAATALLTGFLLSPFIQGAITYPTRTLEAGNGAATIARSESYSHPRPYERLDLREKQAIQSAIYQAPNAEVPHLQPICSSGECRWQNFSSLAVCAAVADVSDRLDITGRTSARDVGVPLGDADNEAVHKASLPNGLFLVGGSATCNLNISWPEPSAGSDLGGTTDQGGFMPSRTSLAFSDRDGRVASAIADFFLIYTNQTAASSVSQEGEEGNEEAVFRAVEVLLHFCVNTYEVSTSRGVTTSRVVYTSNLAAENVVASGRVTPLDARDSSSSSPSQGPSSRRIFLRSSRPPSADAEEEGGAIVYSVEREDVALLNQYLLSVFSGVYSDRYGRAIGGQTATSEALGLAMFSQQRSPSFGDAEMRAVVGNLTANVATSLTNAIRAMSPASATGTVLATESYVHVQWAWLTFLAIQIALAVSFLFGIMVQTAVWDVKILKGSPEAALLAISADEKAHLESREGMFLGMGQGGETTRKMRNIPCRFRPGERGWGLELGRREDG